MPGRWHDLGAGSSRADVGWVDPRAGAEQGAISDPVTWALQMAAQKCEMLENQKKSTTKNVSYSELVPRKICFRPSSARVLLI